MMCLKTIKAAYINVAIPIHVHRPCKASAVSKLSASGNEVKGSDEPWNFAT